MSTGARWLMAVATLTLKLGPFKHIYNLKINDVFYSQTMVGTRYFYANTNAWKLFTNLNAIPFNSGKFCYANNEMRKKYGLAIAFLFVGQDNFKFILNCSFCRIFMSFWQVVHVITLSKFFSTFIWNPVAIVNCPIDFTPEQGSQRHNALVWFCVALHGN